MNVFKVGKYKGKNPNEVPHQYLVWYFENVSKDICSKELYRKSKDATLQENVEHEAFVDSMN